MYAALHNARWLAGWPDPAVHRIPRSRGPSDPAVDSGLREMWPMGDIAGGLAGWRAGWLCALCTLLDPGKCRRLRSAAWRQCPIPTYLLLIGNEFQIS